LDRRSLITCALIGVASLVAFGACGPGTRQVGNSPTLAVSPAEIGTVAPSTTPTPTPSATPTGPAVRPVGYDLPPDCAYVGEAERRDATTYWLVKCPVGLLSRALAPSLAAQGWDNCGSAAGTTYYRKGFS